MSKACIVRSVNTKPHPWGVAQPTTMALVQQPTSAANLLALLDEEDNSLRLYALRALNAVVHDFWFQIASAIASVDAF